MRRSKSLIAALMVLMMLGSFAAVSQAATEWPAGPWSELLPDQWYGLGELTYEYIFRQSDPEEDRPMEGNLYTTGWPIVKDKVTLDVMVPAVATIENYDTNILTIGMEEKTNVHINWITVPQADVTAQRNLALASGAPPDVFMGMGFNHGDEMLYGDKQEMLINLNPYIEKYGEWMNKEFAHRPDALGGSTTPSGAVYTLPEVYTSYHVQYPAKGWIHAEWLAEAGLPMPKTTDDLYEVLKAFKANHPGSIPFAGSPKGWVTDLRGYLLSPFILDDYANPSFPHMIVEDGVVSSVLTTPEYRAGLEYMHKLMAEGLIEENSFIRDKAELRAVGDNPEKVILGGGSSAWAGGLATQEERKDLYVCMPPLEGPEGNSYTYYSPDQINTGVFAISATCKYPEVAFRWADTWYTPEVSHYSQHGRLGEEWIYAEAGQLGDGGTQAVFNYTNDIMENLTTQNILYWGIDVPFAYGSAELEMLGFNPEGENAYNAVMARYTRNLYDDHGMSEILPSVLYVSMEDASDHARIYADRVKLYEETTVKFIREGVTDATWQKWCDDLKALGEDKIVGMAQKAYDTYKSE